MCIYIYVCKWASWDIYRARARFFTSLPLRRLRWSSRAVYGPGLLRAGPLWGRAVYTSLYGARLSSVPSGDQSANYASVPGWSGLQRANLSVSSARKRSGNERLATPSGVLKAARSAIPCWSSALGHWASSSKHTRGLFRETGSLCRGFARFAWGAKHIKIGSSPRNGHCKDCMPPLAAESFRGLHLLELRWVSLWVVEPRWASLQKPSMWSVAGLLSVPEGFASMNFPQWAFSHRHCARSGRTRSRSCSWRHIGPLGPGTQSWCSSWHPPSADSYEERSTDSETGHLVTPASRPLETSCLVPGRDAEFLVDLPQEVVDTITSARAPSTRHAYALKWNLFIEWCSSHREDHRNCPIRVMLSFLQQGLKRRLSPSTLKVNVAAIAVNHDPWKRSWWGSMTGSSGSLGGQEGWMLHAPPLYPLWTCL